ncbi:putative Cation efflux family [Leishmania shawi]|uniref:Cation efflux family n=2 Tax=Leishmania guyanensis species complex TaxID=38579 RepID=A0AAW3CBG6_9TRYP|nr:cation transporter, putative [Leishmania guyanensis]
MRRLFVMKSPAVAKTTAGAASTQLNTHSHSHSHSHGSIEKNISGKLLRQCQIATLAGGATNVFFCVTKLWIGSAGGSVALLADGFHSLTDILADIISYAAISLSRKKLPRCRFPLGIGRLETSGAVIVAAILFFGGVALLIQSLEQCFSELATLLVTAAPTRGIAAVFGISSHRAMPEASGKSTLASATAGHDHAHGSHIYSHAQSNGGGDHQGHSHFQVMQYDEGIGEQVILWTMVGIAAGSVVCKELLFRWTRRVGLRAGSRVVLANAYHHRADAWSGGVALIGVAGQVMGLPGVDGFAGLAVSLSICKMGYGIFKDAVLEFFDYQNAKEVCVIREQLQKFNLHIVRGVDVVPNYNSQDAVKAATSEAEASSANYTPTALSSDEDDTVHRKKIHFINVFLVRHGHQYAVHVTLLVHESVSAQKIQEATDLITALARRSLSVQDTFTTLLLCSNYTESRDVSLCGCNNDAKGTDEEAAAATSSGASAGDHHHHHSHAGPSDSYSHTRGGDDNATSALPIAATGAIINPSLERCITSLQEFHTFTAPIRYSWEERTITAPSSESCECERDISSVAEMFKCRLVGGGLISSRKAAEDLAERSCHSHFHGAHPGHSH